MIGRTVSENPLVFTEEAGFGGWRGDAVAGDPVISAVQRIKQQQEVDRVLFKAAKHLHPYTAEAVNSVLQRAQGALSPNDAPAAQASATQVELETTEGKAWHVANSAEHADHMAAHEPYEAQFPVLGGEAQPLAFVHHASPVTQVKYRDQIPSQKNGAEQVLANRRMQAQSVAGQLQRLERTAQQQVAGNALSGSTHDKRKPWQETIDVDLVATSAKPSTKDQTQGDKAMESLLPTPSQIEMSPGVLVARHKDGHIDMRELHKGPSLYEQQMELYNGMI